MIVLFCPSRGRPKAAAELHATFQASVTGNAQLVFLLDEDDPTAKDYRGNVIVGEPTGDPTGPLNREALRCPEAIVGFIGDDSRCETRGWDRMVEQALREPGFSWGMDGTNESPWPSTCFISRDIVQALGWMVPPAFRRGYFDVAWVHLAAGSNSAHLIPAMFRHDNSAGNPKSPNFKPEAQVPPEVIAADKDAYQAWLSTAQKDVAKIRKIVDLAHFFPAA